MVGFRSQFVWVLFNETGSIHCIAKKRDNAERQIPENKRNKKTQLENHVDWSYGRSKPWTLKRVQLIDGNDLFSQDNF